MSGGGILEGCTGGGEASRHHLLWGIRQKGDSYGIEDPGALWVKLSQHQAAAAATPAGSPYTTAAAAAARSPSAAASLSHGTLTLSHGCSLPLSAVLAASHTPFPSDSPLYTPLAAAVAAEAYLLDVAAAVAAAPEASSEHLVVGARKHSWKGARMVHVHV